MSSIEMSCLTLNPPCFVHIEAVFCLEYKFVLQPLVFTITKQNLSHLCHKVCFPKDLKMSACEVDLLDKRDYDLSQTAEKLISTVTQFTPFTHMHFLRLIMAHL